MCRPTVLAVVATAAALLAVPPLAHAQERRFEETYDLDGATELLFEMGVGELEVVGGAGDRIEIAVRIDCDGNGWGSGSCESRAKAVHFDSSRRGDRLALSLEGTGAWKNRGMEIDVVVRVPARLATTIDMGIGELTVSDMTGDVAIDLGIGEVNVRMAEADVHSVMLDVGTGEASLRGVAAGRRENAGLFVSALHWDDGSGRARVRVDLGIGEIDVRLD